MPGGAAARFDGSGASREQASAIRAAQPITRRITIRIRIHHCSWRQSVVSVACSRSAMADNDHMDLQQRAVELAKSNSFGVEALDLNLQITRDDPSNQGAWTRLARCYLEQRRFADAAGALATVLDLN